MNHNIINSRECLSLPKNEINLDDSNNNNDTCAVKENFNSYQVKCIKKLQNVNDAFLKNYSLLKRTKKILRKKNMMGNMRDF